MHYAKRLAPLLLGVTFIYPNAGGWTTITPGARNGGIHQYMVTPSYPGTQPVPTYQQPYQTYHPQRPTYQPSLPGYEDDDDE